MRAAPIPLPVQVVAVVLVFDSSAAFVVYASSLGIAALLQVKVVIGIVQSRRAPLALVRRIPMSSRAGTVTGTAPVPTPVRVVVVVDCSAAFAVLASPRATALARVSSRSVRRAPPRPVASPLSVEPIFSVPVPIRPSILIAIRNPAGLPALRLSMIGPMLRLVATPPGGECGFFAPALAVVRSPAKIAPRVRIGPVLAVVTFCTTTRKSAAFPMQRAAGGTISRLEMARSVAAAAVVPPPPIFLPIIVELPNAIRGRRGGALDGVAPSFRPPRRLGIGRTCLGTGGSPHLAAAAVAAAVAATDA